MHRRVPWTTIAFVVFYLAVVAGSNVLVNALGPIATPYTAFFLIALGMILRRLLQDFWTGKQLVLGVGGLIVSGCVLSWLVVPVSGRVSLASAIGFIVSGIVGSVLYAKLKRHRMNLSILIEAIVDSFVFLGIAFGWPLNLHVIYAQVMAKVAGGVIWPMVLMPREG